jgi:hypothetical protein
MARYKTNKAAKLATENGDYYDKISKLWNSDGMPQPTWNVAMEYKKFGFSPEEALEDRNRDWNS